MWGLGRHHALQSHIYNFCDKNFVAALYSTSAKEQGVVLVLNQDSGV